MAVFGGAQDQDGFVAVVVVTVLKWVKLLALRDVSNIASENLEVAAASRGADRREIRHRGATSVRNIGVRVASDGAGGGGETSQDGEGEEKSEAHGEMADVYDGL